MLSKVFDHFCHNLGILILMIFRYFWSWFWALLNIFECFSDVFWNVFKGLERSAFGKDYWVAPSLVTSINGSSAKLRTRPNMKPKEQVWESARGTRHALLPLDCFCCILFFHEGPHCFSMCTVELTDVSNLVCSTHRCFPTWCYWTTGSNYPVR